MPKSNIVLFSTGYGDGGYPVYVGFDADGRPTRVVIDFLISSTWRGPCRSEAPPSEGRSGSPCAKRTPVRFDPYPVHW